MNLFKIGNFQVTLVHLILLILIIVLIVAIIAYRFNHRKQTKASQYMDNECMIYNKKGIIKFLSRKGGKFTNPTVVVVEIRNLSYLYINYAKRNKLLYQISDHLTKGLTKRETISRIEFDKFLIVFNDRSKEEVKAQCQIMEKRLDEMTIDGYGMYDFYVYYGIYEQAPLDDPELVYVAAAITTFSKLIEDNNQYFYTGEVRDILNKFRRMNSEKDVDFEQNRFVPYIQPKVDLSTGKVVGGEILCRWMDDSNGFKFSPADFIPIFEKTGFIRFIDEAMLKAACQFMQTLIQRGRSDLVISVNLSRILFMTPNFENRIMEIVNQYQISPKNIELEISEDTFMDNTQYISGVIMRLRQFGFTLSMDDFGKEHSSMDYISTKPFDVVKLDLLFFKNRLSTEKDLAIVKNMLDMLSKLNYVMVCEGVSDRQTLEALAAIRRDVIVQGYVISQPIPLPQFEAFAGTIFDFKLPPLESEVEEDSDEDADDKDKKLNGTDTVETTVLTTPNGGTSINISGLGGTTVVPEHDKELEEMRRQMDEMRHQFQLTLEEQKRLAHEEEVKRLKEQMENMRNQPQPQVQPTTVTIKQNDDEINALKLEIERLKNQKNPNSSEIDALRLEIERLKLQQNTTNTTTYIQRDYRDRDYYGYRDDEVSRLRREVDDLRYSSRERRFYDYDRYQIHVSDNRDREFEILQKQIDDLKENQKNQPVFNVDELIAKLSKAQDNSRYEIEKAQAEAKSLRERLEQERREREELEALIDELQTVQAEETKEEVVYVDEEAQAKEQEEADLNLNLDLSTLSKSDAGDDDDDDDDDDEEKLVKPTLSLEELEAIIQSYRDKYNDEWNQHAKEELQDGYWEIIDGLNYYKRARLTFTEKMRKASPEVKQLFNIVKNELMKYKGVNNRLTNYYDCFYLGRKQICKLSLTSKKLKVYLAADPNQYPERQFPHKDVSEKKAHQRTPYYTMVKSQLSVRRINKVIADVMEEGKSSINESYRPVDYATKLKYQKN
ncbi:MAG: EAL domain-containing protein [Anaeroplasmataceae bacterium]|nr:EAL domain-containing protein [Anaeroplasmataceae bacterium]